MARTSPALITEAAGQLITAQAWNLGVKIVNDWFKNRPTFQSIQPFPSSVPNNVWQPVGFDSATIDTDGGHSASVNTSRYTVQITGWYWVTGKIAWNSSGSGTFRMDSAVAYNGSIVAGGSQFLYFSLADEAASSCSTLVYANPGDYFEIWGRQESGASQIFDNGSVGDGLATCSFAVLWVN